MWDKFIGKNQSHVKAQKPTVIPATNKGKTGLLTNLPLNREQRRIAAKQKK